MLLLKGLCEKVMNKLQGPLQLMQIAKRMNCDYRMEPIVVKWSAQAF